jgi:hypothetical protein
MTTTEIVAVIGTISTPVVAIAGYIFNERRARADRQATRELAEDSHGHERQLAEGQRTHEALLRRHERLYEVRRQTYLDLLRQFLVEVQIIERTEWLGDREPPPPPPEHEYREIRAQVGVFGSRDVSEAVEALDSAIRGFHNAVDVYRGARDQKEGPARKEYEEVNAARTEASTAYVRVRTLVRDELARL